MKLFLSFLSEFTPFPKSPVLTPVITISLTPPFAILWTFKITFSILSLLETPLALGIVQNRSGKVIKRFKVDIRAFWEGNIGYLDEKFVYSDGKKESRIWELKEISQSVYEGRADDVIGIANGETAGNAFYFEYNLDLPVGDTTYKVNFADWMFLLDKNTLLARSYMSKWGIGLGEVTIVMSKKG